MIVLTKPEAAETPTLSPASRVRLVPVAQGRWRVLDRVGRAIGHLDATFTTDGVRYAARRYHAPSRGFRELGAFWSAADAVDCLRSSA